MTWHAVGGTTHPRQTGTIFGRIDDPDRGVEEQTSPRGDRKYDKTGEGSRLAHGYRSHDIRSAIRRRGERKK